METYPVVCGYYIKRPREDHQSTSFLSSPARSEAHSTKENLDASKFTLSRYFSSRSSENSFVGDERNVPGGGGGVNSLVGVEEEDGEEEWFDGRERGLWWKYCSIRSSNSLAWNSLQICWRLLLCLAVGLLVFYCATRPPPPKFSIQVNGIREFRLGEGVDAHGVPTKILTTNISMNLLIENKSKLFRLHIHSTIMEMSFHQLRFAFSNGPRLLAKTYAKTQFDLNVATRNKPMYGAGRNMQDMWDSRRGLPLVIHLRLSSHFRVVGDLIKPKFHHEAECLLNLHRKYDKKHTTQKYTSSCRAIAS